MNTRSAQQPEDPHGPLKMPWNYRRLALGLAGFTIILLLAEAMLEEIFPQAELTSPDVGHLVMGVGLLMIAVNQLRNRVQGHDGRVPEVLIFLGACGFGILFLFLGTVSLFD